MQKTCSKCKQTLDISLFYKRGDGSGRYRSECKSCERKQRTCPICQIKHTSTYTKTKSEVCPTCYPTYRLAYCLHANAIHRSKKLGIHSDLDVMFIYNQLLKPCPMTGFKYVFNTGKNMGDRNPYSPSMDKIDPTKGYTKKNTRIVCWWYNVTKQRFSDEEVLKLCQAVVTSSGMSVVQNVQDLDEIDQVTT